MPCCCLSDLLKRLSCIEYALHQIQTQLEEMEEEDPFPAYEIPTYPVPTPPFSSRSEDVNSEGKQDSVDKVQH